MASYKEKNFIADEKPQKVRPGKRTSPGWEYVKNLGSSKERVEDWQNKGLDRRAAFASTAIDEIVEELKKIQNRKEVQPGDAERLSELADLITDVQRNGENSKWVKDHAEEYYGRTPNPDEYIPEDEGAEKKGKKMFDPAMKCPSCGEPMLFQIGGGRVKCYNCGEETGDIDNLEMYKSSHGTSSLEDFIPPGAKIGVDNEYIEYSEKPKALTKDHIEKYGEEMLKKLGASDEQIAEAKKDIDTNDNGEIEVDEMADFQKSLDDYAAKNKKGRDDIPVTTRR